MTKGLAFEDLTRRSAWRYQVNSWTTLRCFSSCCGAGARDAFRLSHKAGLDRERQVVVMAGRWDRVGTASVSDCGRARRVRSGSRGGAGSASGSASGRVSTSGSVGVVSLSQVAGLPVVLDVPSAGRLLGIGRTRAYRLAASDGFPCPVLRVGGSWRVPTAGVLEVLGLPMPVGQDQPANGGRGMGKRC